MLYKPALAVWSACAEVNNWYVPGLKLTAVPDVIPAATCVLPWNNVPVGAAVNATGNFRSLNATVYESCAATVRVLTPREIVGSPGVPREAMLPAVDAL
jgi:hypothetical protein